MQRKLFKTLLLFSIVSLYLLISTKQIFALNVGEWIETSPLPYPIASHVSFLSSGKIYIVAGATSVVTSNIAYSEISPDGSLSTWSNNATYFPGPLYWHTVARKNNIIYVLGGAIYSPYQPQNAVRFTDVSSGQITSWATTAPLSVALQLGGSVVSGDYIYYAGGFNNNVNDIRNKVYYSHINPDGSVDSWNETTALPTPLTGFGMFESGDKIIIIGGRTAGGPQDKVLEADILSDGNLGDWVENITARLPTPMERAGITKVENSIFSVIGSRVFYSQIQSKGSLGAWSESSKSFPQNWSSGSLTATDTHLYFTGGHDGVNYFSNVYYAPIENEEEILDVPDIKQFTEPWGSQIYDFANMWFPSNPTITRWGCALTSAVMVLNYHGDSTDPSDLNNWLDSNNGYTRNGAVIWPAVSRYSKLSQESPTLEFSYLPFSIELAKSELNNKRPPILKLLNNTYGGNHFLVAKGYNSNIYVNDSANSTNDTLSEANSYWGDTVKLGKFTPSNSDLSYLILFINEDYEIKVSSDSGEIIGEQYNFKDGPMLDPNNPNTDSDFEVLNSFYFPKPSKGIYTVEISGPTGNYQLDAQLYDSEGDVKVTTFESNLSDTESDSFLINFEKQSSEESSMSDVTLASLLEDIDQAYRDRKIKKRVVYKTLRSLVYVAEKFHNRDRNYLSKLFLKLAERRIERFTPKFIEQDTGNYLIYKITLLMEEG